MSSCNPGIMVGEVAFYITKKKRSKKKEVSKDSEEVSKPELRFRTITFLSIITRKPIIHGV